VGVKGLRYPITVLDKNEGQQRTIASINMYVSLPQHFKGTHMSRFIEILNKHSGSLDIRSFGKLLPEIKEKLEADSAYVELHFPYFIKKHAPVSGSESLVDYDVIYKGIIDHDNNKSMWITVHVPICTVCPCSKEISDRGAHNQRGMVRLSIQMKKFMWLEDLILLVESAGSGQLYALLKREDEKFCTEFAYDHPRFVEDVVREVGARLRDDANVTRFKVETETIESIHNHNAYACIEMDKLSAKEDTP